MLSVCKNKIRRHRFNTHLQLIISVMELFFIPYITLYNNPFTWGPEDISVNWTQNVRHREGRNYNAPVTEEDGKTTWERWPTVVLVVCGRHKIGRIVVLRGRLMSTVVGGAYQLDDDEPKKDVVNCTVLHAFSIQF